MKNGLLTGMFIFFIVVSCSKDKNEVITAIQIDKSTVTLKLGEENQFNPTHIPDNLPSPEYKWESSNNKVVTVDEKGLIKGVGLGSSTITVSALDGKLKSSSNITVVPIEANGITLSKINLTLLVGETSNLTYIIEPDNTTNKEVEWSSLNTEIGTVENGTVKALKPGTVAIQIKIKNTDKIASCQVTVNPIAVSSISLNKTNVEIVNGTSSQLLVTISPSNATDKTVIWASSNSSIATIDQGKITGISVGEATITVTTNDGSFKSTCQVKVLPVPVSGISLDKPDLSLMVDESYQLIVTIQPTNAANKSVVWSSSDQAIIIVDSNGNIQAKSLGTAQVKVTSVDGNLVAICNISVVSITEKISLTFSGSTVSINGWITGNLYSIITNKSNYAITLTKFEIIDSNTNTVKVSTTDVSKLGILDLGKSTNLGANLSNIYKPIFKWYFTFNGINYVIQHQYGI